MYFLVPSLTSYFRRLRGYGGLLQQTGRRGSHGSKGSRRRRGRGRKDSFRFRWKLYGGAVLQRQRLTVVEVGMVAGAVPALPQGPAPPRASGPGGRHLLGGGSPMGLPPGGGPLPPLSGGNAAAIPVRQLPSVPQPRPVPLEAPAYSPYEIISLMIFKRSTTTFIYDECHFANSKLQQGF
jgi:hypothetical protein